MRQRREARPKVILSDAQLEYLQTGGTDDPDTWLDWAGGRDEGEVRETFLAIRDDYPPGTFLWAEKQFGGKR